MSGLLIGFGLGMMMVAVIYGLDLLLCGESGLPKMKNPPPVPESRYNKTIRELRQSGKFYSNALYIDDRGNWVYAKDGDRFGDKDVKMIIR